MNIPIRLRHAVLPDDVRGHGNDDGYRCGKCVGQNCDLNRQGTEFLDNLAAEIAAARNGMNMEFLEGPMKEPRWR